MSTSPRMLTVVGSLAVAAAANGQISLPIIADSSFASLPAESIIGSQLASWGVKIGPIDLPLDLESLALPFKASSLLGSERRAWRSRGVRVGGRGVGDLIEVDVDVERGGWGEADNVARGERGDTEVRT